MATEDEIETQTDDTETEDSTQDDTGGESSGGDEGDQGQRASGEDQRPSRRERRANRMREASEAARAAKEEREQLLRHLEEVRRESAEMRGRLEELTRSRQQPAGDPEAPLKEKLRSLRQQWEGVAALASSAKDAATQRRYLDQAYDLEEQMNDVRLDMRELRQKANAPQQTEANMNPLQIAVASEFPAVATNAKLRRRADAYFEDLVEDGKPVSHATLRQAILMAQRDLGIGGQSAPSAQSRQRFAGVGAGEAEGGGGSSRPGITPEDVKRGPFRKMAELAYPGDEPDVAYRKWAKNEGSKLNGAGA